MDRAKIARLVGIVIAVLGAAYGGTEYQAAREAVCSNDLAVLTAELNERKAYACTCENGSPVPKLIEAPATAP